MIGSSPSWSDLSQPGAGGPGPKPDNEFDAVCAEVFTSGSGKRLLAVLRRKHFESGGNALADERVLRVRITQQEFIRDLERACERGLAAGKKAP
jgi:hypothetical protein